jgi:hypothetical protein
MSRGGLMLRWCVKSGVQLTYFDSSVMSKLFCYAMSMSLATAVRHGSKPPRLDSTEEQIAFVDTETGQLNKGRLGHSEEAQKFYRDCQSAGNGCASGDGSGRGKQP